MKTGVASIITGILLLGIVVINLVCVFFDRGQMSQQNKSK